MALININDLVNLNEPVKIKITDDCILTLNTNVKTLLLVQDYLSKNDLTKDDNALDAIKLIINEEDFKNFEKTSTQFNPHQIVQILTAIWEYWLNYVTGNSFNETKNSKKK